MQGEKQEEKSQHVCLFMLQKPYTNAHSTHYTDILYSTDNEMIFNEHDSLNLCLFYIPWYTRVDS